MIIGEFKAGIIIVDELIITEKRRGEGIGKKLIEKVIAYGKDNSAHKISLQTGSDWLANSFYQKLGFKKIVDLPNYYLHHDFVMYEKELDS